MARMSSSKQSTYRVALPEQDQICDSLIVLTTHISHAAGLDSSRRAYRSEPSLLFVLALSDQTGGNEGAQLTKVLVLLTTRRVSCTP